MLDSREDSRDNPAKIRTTGIPLLYTILLLTNLSAAQDETPGATTRRTAKMETNFRYRYLTVPDSVIDIWYFDEDDPGANPYKRPSLRAYAVGLEYVLKPEPINWIFYVEWMGNQIEEGYWDDVEDGNVNHDDGNWVRPNGFGAIVMGANGAREMPVTNPDNDVWASLMLGGGLGIAFMTGELIEWNPGGDPGNTDLDCLSSAAAFDRYLECEPDSITRIPGVLPVLDLQASVKVNFGDRAHIRLEGGLHNLLYMGTAVGASF